MEPLLEVSGLEKRLGTLHLNQISFRVEPGHIAGLVGVNGAWKTTLLHTILNLYDKNGGRVTVCGYDMDTQEREAKDRLGLVLDEMMYEKGLSGLENARLYGRLYHHFNESLFLELCERFELPPNRKLGLLSTGFKMRFQFAFALSHNARLFLMDEPASSVRTLDAADPAAAVQKIGFVSEERQFFWAMDVLENGAGAEIEALLTGKFRIRDLLEKYGETV